MFFKKVFIVDTIYNKKVFIVDTIYNKKNIYRYYIIKKYL